MPFKIHCSCGQKIRVPDQMKGHHAKCPRCHKVLTLTPLPQPAETDESKSETETAFEVPHELDASDLQNESIVTTPQYHPRHYHGYSSPSSGLWSALTGLAIAVFVMGGSWALMSSPKPQLAPSPSPNPVPLAHVPTPPSAPEAPARSIAAAPLNPEEIVATAEPSVALIQWETREAKYKGTGFLVKPNVVATNKHVVAGSVGGLNVTFPSAGDRAHETHWATVLYEDPILDLAFLCVGTPLKPLPISKNLARRGQEVIAIGNPSIGDQTLENAISRGVVSTSIKLDETGQDYYQLNIAINHGNSGGPVLDAHGEVIGVLTLRATQLEGTAFCIPNTQLEQSLYRMEKHLEDAQRLTDAKQKASIDERRSDPAYDQALKESQTIYQQGLAAYRRLVSEGRDDAAAEALSAFQRAAALLLPYLNRQEAQSLLTEINPLKLECARRSPLSKSPGQAALSKNAPQASSADPEQQKMEKARNDLYVRLEKLETELEKISWEPEMIRTNVMGINALTSNPNYDKRKEEAGRAKAAEIREKMTYFKREIYALEGRLKLPGRVTQEFAVKQEWADRNSFRRTSRGACDQYIKRLAARGTVARPEHNGDRPLGRDEAYHAYLCDFVNGFGQRIRNDIVLRARLIKGYWCVVALYPGGGNGANQTPVRDDLGDDPMPD